MKKKILIILIGFFIIITIAFSLIISKQENNEITKTKEMLLRIEDIKNPRQILWYRDNLYIVVEKEVKRFDLKTRKLEPYAPIEEKQILALYLDNLVYVEYQNKIIESPEEYATEIKVFTLEQNTEIFSAKYHETIKPTYIEDNFLFLIDNYPNSPEREYRVDLKTKTFEKYEPEKINIKGVERIQIFNPEGEKIFDIPLVNRIQNLNIDKDAKKVGIIDIEGNVWIYLEN